MSKMLFNVLSLEVLGLFLRDLEAPHHGREIAKTLGLNQKTVSNTLRKLEKERLLTSTSKGRNKEYTIRFDDLERTKRLLVLLENARTIRFMDKNPKIKEIIEKSSPHHNGIIILFGSYAKGNAKKDSDLDLFIAGECRRDEIKEASALYGIEANIKKTDKTSFIHLLRKKDPLIKEVISNHYIIAGAEEYIKYLLEEYYDRKNRLVH